MVEVITVAPAGSGWVLTDHPLADKQVFESGALAEQAAIRLAERISAGGAPVVIRILLRDGSLGGSVLCPPRQRTCDTAPVAGLASINPPAHLACQL